MAFSDDFWCRFISVAIKLFSLSFQFIRHALTPRQPIAYFICIGVDPSKFPGKPTPAYGIVQVLTVLIQLFVQIRIRIYKHQDFHPASTGTTRRLVVEKISLTSIILNFANAAVLTISTMSMVIISAIEPKNLVVHPYSLVVQFVFICLPPLLGVLMATTFFIKHKSFRNAIRKHFIPYSLKPY